MTKVYDVTIIGAGAGGITSAVYASRSGLSVALIERGLYGGVINDTSEIENYSGFTSIDGTELASKFEEQAMAQENVDHIYGDVLDVKKMNREFYETELRNGKVIQSKTLIIATGVKHKKLGIVGEEEYRGRSVSSCATCDANFFKGKHTLVIGGGDSAVEAALYLSDIVEKVTLVHRRDELIADQVTQDRMFAKDNVDVVWNALTEEVVGNGMHMTGINYTDRVTGEKHSLEAEGMFVYIGVEPVSEPFKDLIPLSPEGYIGTWNDMSVESDYAGLYAVGDIRYGSIRQISTAVGDGTIAAMSAYDFVKTGDAKYF